MEQSNSAFKICISLVSYILYIYLDELYQWDLKSRTICSEAMKAFRDFSSHRLPPNIRHQLVGQITADRPFMFTKYLHVYMKDKSSLEGISFQITVDDTSSYHSKSEHPYYVCESDGTEPHYAYFTPFRRIYKLQ